jgi:hypothetical protein
MDATFLLASIDSTEDDYNPVVLTPARPSTFQRTKRPRDPDAPKRACSAFLLFSSAHRASVKADHPDATGADLLRRLGERWRTADADTKAKYGALFLENKARADAARRAYADRRSNVLEQRARPISPPPL